MNKKPDKLKKGNITYVITPYGSYVNDREDGIAQQKNACSSEELIKLGFKPTDKKK